jgi:hypothetical protein
MVPIHEPHITQARTHQPHWHNRIAPLPFPKLHLQLCATNVEGQQRQ